MHSASFYLKFPIIIHLLISLLMISTLSAAPKRHVVENPNIKMIVIPRTAQQMAAFYEGREFPTKAIKATRNACFFTIGIHNKTKSILWLEQSNWSFTTDTKQIMPISRNDWKQHWQELQLPQRFQSTFRWTLLPGELDFHPDEREGGNITLPRSDASFTLTARFATQADKQGKPVTVSFDNLRCAREDTP